MKDSLKNIGAGGQDLSRDSELTIRKAREDFERRFILQALRRNGGNVSKTAREIGLHRVHLHRKIRQYGIDVEDLM